MYPSLLWSTSFHEFLYAIDLDLAEQVRAKGCACGGALHSARYRRKPRGGPPGAVRAHEYRFSFCCAEQGCRKRATPVSVRFLGRRVYLAAVVLVVAALRDGLSRRRVEQLRSMLGVSERTLRRWRQWWLKRFVTSRLWRSQRGRFVPAVEPRELPRSLLERFAARDPAEAVIACLKFLAPLSSRSCPVHGL